MCDVQCTGREVAACQTVIARQGYWLESKESELRQPCETLAWLELHPNSVSISVLFEFACDGVGEGVMLKVQVERESTNKWLLKLRNASDADRRSHYRVSDCKLCISVASLQVECAGAIDAVSRSAAASNRGRAQGAVMQTLLNSLASNFSTPVDQEGLAMGQQVEMKNEEDGSWLGGYVTSLDPLTVGIAKDGMGTTWDCVRTAPEENAEHIIRYIPEFGPGGERFLGAQTEHGTYRLVFHRGVAYRRSPNISDRDETRSGPAFNDIVKGELFGGWLKMQVAAAAAQGPSPGPSEFESALRQVRAGFAPRLLGRNAAS